MFEGGMIAPLRWLRLGEAVTKVRHFAPVAALFTMPSRNQGPPAPRSPPGARRYWRDAATVIVVAPSDAGPSSSDSDVTPSDIPHSSNDTHIAPSNYSTGDDFGVLMLKRGQESSFMANKFVYPGGVKSEHDSSPDWRDIFRDVTSLSMDEIATAVKIPGARPPALRDAHEADSSQHYEDEDLSPEVAMKICAIRETFEESGVLLVSHRNEFRGLTGAAQLQRERSADVKPKMFNSAAVTSSSDMVAWRRAVESDAGQFLALCQKMEVVPNIWALYEWSNWLTPSIDKVEAPPPKPRRFDTIFYICVLDERAENVVPDAGETTVAEWRTPREWLELHRKQQLTLPWPQVYETQRLSQLSNRQALASYTRQREPLGLQRWMEAIKECREGAISLLPGDELYPDRPDYEGLTERTPLAGTPGELLRGAHRLHRGVLLDGQILYMCNVRLPCGQLSLPPGNITLAKAKLSDTRGTGAVAASGRGVD